MKRRSLIIVFLIICLSLSGATYYIAPNGKDSNPGSLSQPFFTLNKAWTVISAGDIVYLRGGTYLFPTSQELTGKNGTSGSLIKIWAYPGEIPVLTKVKSGWTYRNREGIHFEGSYFHWKGIEIAGFGQVDGNMYPGLRIVNSNHNIFELINHHHNGSGLQLTDGCDDNLFLNCDSHNNYDPLTTGDPYGNADGFAINPSPGSTNRFTGCRSWNNSDDGYDLYNCGGLIIFDKCWAWGNGYREDGSTIGGNGTGYKLGQNSANYLTTHLRTITNCLAFNNRSAGFSINGGSVSWIYNNTAYHNAENTDYRLGFEFNDNNGITHILRNNISFENQNPTDRQANWTNESIEDHNSWDSGFKVTESDFVSTDSLGVSETRGSTGDLPDINFLKLAKGSDLIDAGIDVGVPYSGEAPDIGAFEFQDAPTAPFPVLISSVVENEAPSLLVMTFDLTLNNLVVPATSSFNVLVNSLNTTINSVSISGNKVQLTLTNAVKFGDIISLSYIKPANPLQTVSGREVESIRNKTVTNNCKAPNEPNNPLAVEIKFLEVGSSGFVYELDASGSHDLNNAILSYEWTVPNNVSVSSTTVSKIKFLSPVVNTSKIIEFQLKVNNGRASSSKSISINILPYKPDLEVARIISTSASSYLGSDYPNNVSDMNLTTKWSAFGDNQWLFSELAGSYRINHLEIAFLPGQNYSSYFDIYASKDNLVWEPILINATSCNFSGDTQVFDFPLPKINTEYAYVKFVGHGNSLNNLNNISEFKIFGLPQQNPILANTKVRNVIIYPNPAQDIFNVSIKEPTLHPDKIRLIDFSGKIVFEDSFEQSIKNVQIPTNLKTGVYIVELNSGRITVDAQKLIINR